MGVGKSYEIYNVFKTKFIRYSPRLTTGIVTVLYTQLERKEERYILQSPCTSCQ